MKKNFITMSILPIALFATVGCNNSNNGSGMSDDTIQFDYVFTAQPVVSATNSTVFKNVQDDFKEKSGGKTITQASVFINNEASVDAVDEFLNILKSSISDSVSTPTLLKEGIEKVGSVTEQQDKFGVPGAMAMKVTSANNGFSLGFEWASDIKEDIGSFVNLLTNNTLGEISDDVIYPKNEDIEVTDGAQSLKILAPTGAPAVALYRFAGSENLETTTNPQTGLMPMFKTNNYDVIIAPTQGGLTQIMKQNANYKIAATITFGNFYIVSMGTDDDQTLNEGDKVCIFQENDIPGKVFNYTYSDLKLDVTAVNAVSDTKLIIENKGILKK